MSDQSLILNGGELIADGQGVEYPEGFTVKVVTDGTGWGNPEVLSKTLSTLMTSGSWEVADRIGNRAPSLTVEISAPDAVALNSGEVWLSGLMRPGSLEWRPPRSDVWTVFDVVTARIDFSQDGDWDLDETRFVRTYKVPIRALPHARSADLTVTPAETDALDVLVNDGSSAAGWSSTTGATVSAASGVVTMTWNSSTPYTFGGSGGHLIYEATVDTSVTRYLQVDWLTSSPMVFGFGTSAGSLSEVRRDVLAGGWQRSFYRVPRTVKSVSRLDFDVIHPLSTGSATLKIDQVRRLSRLPFSATTSQKTSAIYPGGSAPAEGNLHIYHPSESLGRTVVHTYPLGRPTPALMQHRQSSETPVADYATLNGQYIPINTDDLVLNVPDFALPIRGLAAIWAKLQVNEASAGSGTQVGIRWTVQPYSNGQIVGQITEGIITIQPNPGERVLLPIAQAVLPPVVTGTAGSSVITLERVSGTGNVYVDEVWAFGQDDESATTIVDCGEGGFSQGGSSNHLWIKAPTAEAPAGQVLVGTREDDARWPRTIQSSQLHKFPPQGVAILVATANAHDPAVELSHYRRWTHHAGD